ncbi:MAG: hypothetical protein ACFFD8_08155, partial [Candidatus Thorarchaeota archaeon]
MKKITLKVSLLVISLLVFQCGIPTPFSPNQARNSSISTVSALQLPINDFITFEINDSYTSEAIEIPITEPGVYEFNLSWTVEEGQPPGVDLDLDLSQSIGWYIHAMGIYLNTLQAFNGENWNNRLTNATDYFETEIIAVRAGVIRADFRLTDYTLGDWIS